MTNIIIGLQIPTEDIWRTEIVKGCLCAVDKTHGLFCPKCGQDTDESMEADMLSEMTDSLVSSYSDRPDLAIDDFNDLIEDDITFKGFRFFLGDSEEYYFFGKSVLEFDNGEPFTEVPKDIYQTNDALDCSEFYANVFKELSELPEQMLAYDFGIWIVN